jgi:hypothetical protein
MNYGCRQCGQQPICEVHGSALAHEWLRPIGGTESGANDALLDVVQANTCAVIAAAALDP